MRTDDLLEDRRPVIARRTLDAQGRWALERAHRSGSLVRLLPGTYVVPGHADDLVARLQAVGLWQPDAVITGSAAARLTFWPTVAVDEIEVAWRGHSPRAPGYTFSQRRIAPEHVVETAGVRITAPALTAVDLCGTLGGDPIDTLLRSRMGRIPDLWAALEEHQHRRGNNARRRLLVESRDEPWSAAERESHQLLHVHRISGWTANFPVLIRGQRYFIDIAFVCARLAIEIDGRLHEDDRSIFERDRYRQNDLVRAGWRVLRFTWSMLIRDPEYVVATIRAELAASR